MTASADAGARKAGAVDLQRQIISDLRSDLPDERERRIDRRWQASGAEMVVLGMAVGDGPRPPVGRIKTDVRYGANPDPRSRSGSAARELGKAATPPFDRRLSRAADYVGAFGRHNWLEEWTFFGAEREFAEPAGQPSGRAVGRRSPMTTHRILARPLQLPPQHLLVRLEADPPQAGDRRVVRRALIQLMTTKRPQAQRVAHRQGAMPRSESMPSRQPAAAAGSTHREPARGVPCARHIGAKDGFSTLAAKPICASSSLRWIFRIPVCANPRSFGQIAVRTPRLRNAPHVGGPGVSRLRPCVRADKNTRPRRRVRIMLRLSRCSESDRLSPGRPFIEEPVWELAGRPRSGEKAWQWVRRELHRRACLLEERARCRDSVQARLQSWEARA